MHNVLQMLLILKLTYWLQVWRKELWISDWWSKPLHRFTLHNNITGSQVHTTPQHHRFTLHHNITGSHYTTTSQVHTTPQHHRFTLHHNITGSHYTTTSQVHTTPQHYRFTLHNIRGSHYTTTSQVHTTQQHSTHISIYSTNYVRLQLEVFYQQCILVFIHT